MLACVVRFMIGDRIRWVHAVSEPQWMGAIGVIIAVIPNDTGVEELTLYDVRFEFGLCTLYATQIQRSDA